MRRVLVIGTRSKYGDKDVSREIWETVRDVTPEEWEDMKRRLTQSHERVLATINSFDKWDGKYDVAGALSVLVHTAYHLGGIRQTLGAIRAHASV